MLTYGDMTAGDKGGSVLVTSGQKAAATRKRRAAAKKAAATRKRRAAGRKAATTRKRSAAATKAAVTRKQKAAGRKAAATRAAYKLSGSGADSDLSNRKDR